MHSFLNHRPKNLRSVLRKLGLTIFTSLTLISVKVTVGQEKQDTLKGETKALRVYFDCTDCDMDYVKTQISSVDYVRDRAESNIYILKTTQPTGGNGLEYTLTFVGQEGFLGRNDTLVFTTKSAETDQIVRDRMVKMLKIGLLRYAAKTFSPDQIDVSFGSHSQNIPPPDPWNGWVFDININNSFNRENLTNFLYIDGVLGARKVTPEMKLKVSLATSYYEDNFEIMDQTISSYSRSKGLQGFVVFSLNDHYSIGVSGSTGSSTYTNLNFYGKIGPAFEYDVFPYSEATRRQFRILYELGYTYQEYYEQTIFEKNLENLGSESLSFIVDTKEPWGSIETTLLASHYFLEEAKYQVKLTSQLQLNLFEGISLLVSGSYARIHDQISLPKRGATEEEVLLQRAQLATQYQLTGLFGLTYTFGSVYNNVVNPRIRN